MVEKVHLRNPPPEPEMTPRGRENKILQGPVFKGLQGLRELLKGGEVCPETAEWSPSWALFCHSEVDDSRNQL